MSSKNIRLLVNPDAFVDVRNIVSQAAAAWAAGGATRGRPRGLIVVGTRATEIGGKEGAHRPHSSLAHAALAYDICVMDVRATDTVHSFRSDDQ